MITHHVFPTLHKFLVDDLACKVLAGLDVDGLLDYGICSTSKRFTCPILEQSSISVPSLTDQIVNGLTWHGTVAGAGIGEDPDMCGFRSG